MGNARFQQLNDTIKAAIPGVIPGSATSGPIIQFLVAEFLATEYAKLNPTGITPGEFFTRVYNGIKSNSILLSNVSGFSNPLKNVYPYATHPLSSAQAATELFSFFKEYEIPDTLTGASINPTQATQIKTNITNFAAADPSDAKAYATAFSHAVTSRLISTVKSLYNGLIYNVLGFAQASTGTNRPAPELKLLEVSRLIYNNDQQKAFNAIRPLTQYCYLSQFDTDAPTSVTLDNSKLEATLESIKTAFSNASTAAQDTLRTALEQPAININSTADSIDSFLGARTNPPGGNNTPPSGDNTSTGGDNTSTGGKDTTASNNTPTDNNASQANQPNPQVNTYGLHPTAFEILQGMSIDDEQLKEALEVLAGGNYYATPYFTTYMPGITEKAAAQLLDNQTEKGSHRPFRVSAGEPGARKTILIPPAFKIDNSQTIWSRAVINNLGFPFINFSSPAVLALIKSSDPKEVKAAYKNVKALFKECHLKRPIDTLKDFAKAKYRNCALNALAVQADELYNAESGMKVTASIIAPYTKNLSIKGTVELPMDFLTAFYTVLSPVQATRQYTELCEMGVTEYLNFLSVNAKPPIYILNPKNLIFRRGPKAGLLHELFSSKTAPILVRARVSGRDGGFMIPERVADKIFTI